MLSTKESKRILSTEDSKLYNYGILSNEETKLQLSNDTEESKLQLGDNVY